MKCKDCGEAEVTGSETMCQDCRDMVTLLGAVDAAQRVAANKRAGRFVAATNRLLLEVSNYARLAATA
jgi:hypothetical protein